MAETKKEVYVPAFVEMKDGSFRAAYDGRITVEDGVARLLLNGTRYRVMRRPMADLETGEAVFQDAWVVDDN